MELYPYQQKLLNDLRGGEGTRRDIVSPALGLGVRTVLIELCNKEWRGVHIIAPKVIHPIWRGAGTLWTPQYIARHKPEISKDKLVIVDTLPWRRGCEQAWTLAGVLHQHQNLITYRHTFDAKLPVHTGGEIHVGPPP